MHKMQHKVLYIKAKDHDRCDTKVLTDLYYYLLNEKLIYQIHKLVTE